MAQTKEEIVSKKLQVSKDSVVVLYKGGRLQSWFRLTPEQQKEYSREHVELMLSIARKYRMMRLEGFKLIAPKSSWQRFWVIEFPTLEGAEEWIRAEMAPPYGVYGYYEYYLARKWDPAFFNDWVTMPPAPHGNLTAPDPNNLPVLQEDRGSYVVLNFGRRLPEGMVATPEEIREVEHVELIKSIARKHGLMRLEGFQLMAPQNDWHRAWVMELPTLEAAEAWIEGELKPPIGAYANKQMYLARKWAPSFFAGWVPR